MRFRDCLIRNIRTLQCIHLALLLLLPLQLMATDCSPAAIVLSSQSAIDNFQRDHGPGCDTIVESLVIDGVDITDLTGLRGLKFVSHWVQISKTGLDDLRGLENLQRVGGTFSVNENDSLTSVFGLERLESAGSVYVWRNPSLQTVQGFSALAGQTHRLIVSDNDALRNLDGLNGIEALSGILMIEYNDVLENVDGLAGLSSIAGAVEIRSNAGLRNLQGLAQVATVGGGWVYILHNGALASISAFQHVTSLANATLRIGANPNLEEIGGFSSLIDAGVITIYSNIALERISGFNSLKTVGDLEILDHPVLGDLSGLSSLSEVEKFTLRAPGALESLSDFSSLSRVGTLWLSQIEALANLSGMSSLQSVGVLGVSECGRLSSLTGIEKVALELAIELGGNEGLLSLNGLNSLRFGEDFGVFLSHNPNLSDISALSGLTRLSTLYLNDLKRVTSLAALTTVEEVVETLTISYMSGIPDLAGLDNIRSVGGELYIHQNSKLADFNGLQSLESGGYFYIQSNPALVSLAGLDGLNRLQALSVDSNATLSDLDGLQSLIAVDQSVTLSNNPILGDCTGIHRLIDEIDDGELGPGPGASGIPDIGDQLGLQGNNPSCNSREAILSGQAPVISTRLEVDLVHADENIKDETIALTCEGVESVTTLSDTANYYRPAIFEIAWIMGDPAECTAVISSSNPGYTPDESDCSSVVLEDETTQTCTIVNHQNPVTIVVEKAFTDGNTMGVSTSLKCSTGTVTEVNPVASSSSPAEFTVRDFKYTGAVCDAQEVMPEGYAQKQSTCRHVPIHPGVGATCRLTNEPRVETAEFEFHVAIDFSDDNPQWAWTNLVCDGAIGIAPDPGLATEEAPAIFRVIYPVGQSVGNCSASIVRDLVGYTVDDSGCFEVSSEGDPPGCVIMLEQLPVSIAVRKLFTDENPAAVEMHLECLEGSVTVIDAKASIADKAYFSVSDFPYDGTECTAAEVMPEGYEQESSSCGSVAVVPGRNSACTIVNTPEDEPDASALTGSWYDPRTSGEGFMIHAVDDETAVAYFYGYDLEGNRLWLIGQSDGAFIPGEAVVFQVVHATEGSFTDLDADRIVRSDWGTFEFTLLNCDSALVNLIGAQGEKTLDLERLAKTSGSTCSGAQALSETDAVTGSWYEPATSGQGFSIHKVAADRGVVYFYGFNDHGENLWLIGVWEREWSWGEELVVPMLRVSGGTYNEVIPDLMVREDWGTLTLRFDDCYHGWGKFEGLDGVQEVELTLLAGSMALECQSANN